MRSLEERYADYLIRYRARIDLRLNEAGQERCGENWLRAGLVRMPGPLPRELFDEVCFSALSEATLPLAENYRSYARRQQGIATLRRIKLGDDQIPIQKLIEKLATRGQHKEEGAPSLWCHFFSALDTLGLEPAEYLDSSDPRKSRIKYSHGDAYRSKSFGSFANDVSRFRRSEKSR